MMVVVPPASAAAVPDSKSSEETVPATGSDICTWGSTPPGKTIRPSASRLSSPPADSRPSPSSTIWPSRQRMSPRQREAYDHESEYRVVLISSKKAPRDSSKGIKVKISAKKIQSGDYDIIILDEVNYAINLDLVKLDDILNLIKSKPETLDLVLTGNHAKDEIIELADLVTEMKEIKHPFQQGKKAKKGIDF